jgi:hypothetical protein
MFNMIVIVLTVMEKYFLISHDEALMACECQNTFM